MHQIHGNDKYNYDIPIIADFSTNVWFRSLPESFYNQLGKALFSIKDYPHPEAGELRNALAEFHELSKSNICVTNGSVEGIYLLAQVFSGVKSSLVFPCFSEYENACLRYKHKLEYFSNREQWFESRFSSDLLWFGNPNNPDGKQISVHEIEKMLAENPLTIFIIDEAFAELCVGFESSVPLLRKYKNLVVLRSFTKCFAIPGIRLGYILASENVVDLIKNYTIPWSVSSIAIEAGILNLKNYTSYLPDKQDLINCKLLVESSLAEFEEIEILPSNTNYYLIHLKTGTASELKKYLVENFGILIRDASNFRGLKQQFFRISCQSEENIVKLKEALKIYFHE